ncbi:MAG TPA: nuclear transport factor 2 family protein [Gaiellaceae bacterium]|nr:nuclear transport factor 2 family protein [Gaiellaceae bacterium]
MDPAAIVKRHIDAFNARDLDALMAGFSGDATWATGSDSFRGAADLEELFASAFAELSPRLHVESLLAQGDRVACELREDYLVDGARRTDHIAGFYRVEAGLITSVKIYREGSADV